ncbi:MAG: hypothetical protein IPK85_06510 [Gemmatimonadetes bacterium]|nr:hypothetical protein [Gemmatimonadota bacterium]
MRTSGDLRGEARLQVTGNDGQLVESRGSFTINLMASANTMSQRVAQVVSFVATRLP